MVTTLIGTESSLSYTFTLVAPGCPIGIDDKFVIAPELALTAGPRADCTTFGVILSQVYDAS